jgi:hypothetical protein
LSLGLPLVDLTFQHLRLGRLPLRRIPLGDLSLSK